MTGYRPGPYWQWTWRYIGPAIMSCILVSSIVCLIINKPEYNAYHAEEVCAQLFITANPNDEMHLLVIHQNINSCLCLFVSQSTTVATEYPTWVMTIGLTMIVAGILPMPAVYLLRRFQILKVDLDIHQGSIRRNETTASTKQMMDDDDVSYYTHCNCPFKETPTHSLSTLWPSQANGCVSVLIPCTILSNGPTIRLNLKSHFVIFARKRRKNYDTICVIC